MMTIAIAPHVPKNHSAARRWCLRDACAAADLSGSGAPNSSSACLPVVVILSSGSSCSLNWRINRGPVRASTRMPLKFRIRTLPRMDGIVDPTRRSAHSQRVVRDSCE